MIISTREIFDMVVMTAALGFIFEGMFRQFRPKKDILEHYRRPGFDWDAFKFAAMVTAPAIILHELGHKFVAMSFGISATFYAAYMWLGIGIILKLINSPFIFFVPAFVAITPTDPGTSALIAFSGPAVNGLLWLASHIAIKRNLVKKKHIPYAYISRYINGFLFIFNMIPIPGFDGSHVFEGVIRAIF